MKTVVNIADIFPKHLFWDVDYKKLDVNTNKNFIIPRAFFATTEQLHKFQQHPELMGYLLGTGNRVLVEASPVDFIWGIGMAQDHADVSDPSKWPGLNLLGFV